MSSEGKLKQGIYIYMRCKVLAHEGPKPVVSTILAGPLCDSRGPLRCAADFDLCTLAFFEHFDLFAVYAPGKLVLPLAHIDPGHQERGLLAFCL